MCSDCIKHVLNRKSCIRIVRTDHRVPPFKGTCRNDVYSALYVSDIYSTTHDEHFPIIQVTLDTNAGILNWSGNRVRYLVLNTSPEVSIVGEFLQVHHVKFC